MARTWTVDRRRFLTAVGVGSAAAVVLRRSDGLAARVRGPGAGAAPTSSRSAVDDLVGDLRPGSRLGRWTVVAIHAVTLGGIPVVLEDAGGLRFQVDVLGRDRSPDAPAAVADTEHLSVYLCNLREGPERTDEERGLGAMALAAHLEERERAGAAIPALVTLRERLRLHPRGAFAVPL